MTKVLIAYGTTEGHTARIAGNPGWSRYGLSRRATMRFDTTSELVDDPRFRERVLWEHMR